MVINLVNLTFNQIRITPQPSALRADVPNALIANHAARKYDALLGFAVNAGRLQLDQPIAHRSFGLAYQPSKLRRAHGLIVHGQMPIRHALMHDAHHFVPQPTRSHPARLERRVLAPIGGIELESRSFQSCFPFLSARSFSISQYASFICFHRPVFDSLPANTRRKCQVNIVHSGSLS